MRSRPGKSIKYTRPRNSLRNDLKKNTSKGLTSMKSKLLVLFVPALLLGLAACAPAASVPPAATMVFMTPDRSHLTPASGSVTVLSPPGAKGIFLRNLPNHEAAVAGEVQPGDTGRILGFH